jgi:hypothetical protein
MVQMRFKLGLIDEQELEALNNALKKKKAM